MGTLHRKTIRQSADVVKRSLGDRVRALRYELAALEDQQRADLMQRITLAFPEGVYTVGQIWSQPELRTACQEADLATPQQLGIWLRSWCECVSRGGGERVWSVSVAD
jgi:hypothetical protein